MVEVIGVVELQVYRHRLVGVPHDAAVGGEQLAIGQVVQGIEIIGRKDVVRQRLRGARQLRARVHRFEGPGVVGQQVGAQLVHIAPLLHEDRRLGLGRGGRGTGGRGVDRHLHEPAHFLGRHRLAEVHPLHALQALGGRPGRGLHHHVARAHLELHVRPFGVRQFLAHVLGVGQAEGKALLWCQHRGGRLASRAARQRQLAAGIVHRDHDRVVAGADDRGRVGVQPHDFHL